MGLYRYFSRSIIKAMGNQRNRLKFLIELFSNLSLLVRPVFPSDEAMVKVISEMMTEALKRRKIKAIWAQ